MDAQQASRQTAMAECRGCSRSFVTATRSSTAAATPPEGEAGVASAFAAQGGCPAGGRQRCVSTSPCTPAPAIIGRPIVYRTVADVSLGPRLQVKRHRPLPGRDPQAAVPRVRAEPVRRDDMPGAGTPQRRRGAWTRPGFRVRAAGINDLWIFIPFWRRSVVQPDSGDRPPGRSMRWTYYLQGSGRCTSPPSRILRWLEARLS